MIDQTILLGIRRCGPENWTTADYLDAALCPFVETIGAAALVLFGFIIFAGLAVYSRTATMPAVIAILFVGLGSTAFPTVGAWMTMRYVIIVAAVLLFVIYMRIKT